ncbi:MAG: hypothetical protein ACK2UL_01250 [Anaerolineae bacterium]
MPRRRPARLRSAKALSERALLAVTVLAALCSGVAWPAPVSAAAPEPDELVLYAPRLGGDFHERRCQCFGEGEAAVCTCESPDEATFALAGHSGIKVQNGGDEDARYLAAYFEAPALGAADACAECTLVGWTCGPPVHPGLGYTLPPFWPGPDTESPTDPTFAASAVVYSLSTTAAGDLGPPWVDWLAAEGLPADTTVADAVCRIMTEPRETDECAEFAAFQAGFTTDVPMSLPGTDLPVADARGVRASAVVAVLDTGANGTLPALDRYGTLTLSEAGRADDVEPALAAQSRLEQATIEHRYVAPGGYGAMLDGTSSTLMVQNVGTDCAEVEVQAHRSRFGPFGEPARLRLPPGARSSLSVSDAWSGLDNTMVALTLTGDQPLAATLVNLGPAISATSSAHRERDSEVRWLVPRAYQEEREVSAAAVDAAAAGFEVRSAVVGLAPAAVDVAGAGVDVGAAHRTAATGADARLPEARRVSRLAQAQSADGWETNLSVFNPGTETRDVLMRMQATGEPPRGPIAYPIEGLAQRVLQPGFGLGLPGGPGWLEMTATGAPMYIGVESLRQAANIPLTIEAWSVGAWAYGDGAAAAQGIALPDLGGPAIGPPSSTLVGQIAIQNPTTATARVAIDTYLDACGHVGAVERSIDPRQTVLVPVADLVGAAQGANRAIVRVLAGEVGAVVEVTEGERRAASVDEPPPDLSNAYRGGRLTGWPLPPAPVSRTLAAEPVELDVARPVTVTERTVALSASPDADGCVTYHAASDVEWLAVAPAAGLVPGTLTLSVDGVRLPSVATNVGHVTVTAEQPGIQGSPIELTVIVTGGGVTELFVPVAWSPLRPVR